MIKNTQSNPLDRRTIRSFKENLLRHGYSANSVDTYVYSVELFQKLCGSLSKDAIQRFKERLMETGKPATINVRIAGINKFLQFIGRSEWKTTPVRIQNRTFIENVISEADYESLKACLLRDGNLRGYYIIWTLAATGARISEFLQMKAEHVYRGYFDMYGKGGKMRRIYFPTRLRESFADWLREQNIVGPIWTSTKKDGVLTANGVGTILRSFGRRYSIDVKVCHPHSFRHFYAKQFLKRSQDITLLADLMGHESLDTTRIYLRRTADEQREEVNRIVVW